VLPKMVPPMRLTEAVGAVLLDQFGEQPSVPLPLNGA